MGLMTGHAPEVSYKSLAELVEVPRPPQKRIESVDLLRGLIMILMAVDHTRDFFTNVTVDPGDPQHSWSTLFITRLMTHICAPGFVALAGLSVYIQLDRGKAVRELRVELVKRGLWLAIFDLFVFAFLISFSLPCGLTMGPLWVSGLSMIALAAVLGLPARSIGVIGLTILALHNLLDPIRASSFGHAAFLWDILHQQAIVAVGTWPVFIGYPVLPWIGILFVGFALGPLLTFTPEKRQRISAAIATMSLVLFALMRTFVPYGNSRPFLREQNAAHTAMSFFDLVKYPPSLDYTLATGGVLLLLFCTLDTLVSRRVLSRVRAWVAVYGRVPFFFFGMHLLVLHVAALALTMALHLNWRSWCSPLALLTHNTPGWGYPLAGVYPGLGDVNSCHVPTLSLVRQLEGNTARLVA